MEKSEEPKRRFRIDVAYDGRPYSGWQSQVGGNTIQDILLEAARKICPEIAGIHGSGRTDAGVSAEKQVAHFDAPAELRMRGPEWQKALNSSLPATIRVMNCGEIDAEFHARFSAEQKLYRYLVSFADVLPPLDAGLVWHQRGFDRFEELSAGVSHFCGEHDFRAFSANRGDGFDETRDTIRSISRAECVRAPQQRLIFYFQGSGFLYKMVRFLVGSAFYYAHGKLSSEELLSLLGGHDSGEKAPFCAPAAGLSLENVVYSGKFEIF